jgi:hypothetical protein
MADLEHERQALFSWLSKIQHRQYHKTMGKDFMPESGQWLLENASFIDWRRESFSSILWLHGIRMCSLLTQEETH